MALFLDACAVAKAYLEEQGKETMQGVLAHSAFAGGRFVSSHMELEVVGVFGRHLRQGKLARSEYDRIMGEFYADYPRVFNVYPFTSSDVQYAVSLARSDPTRSIGALDYLHLASAHTVAALIDPPFFGFVSADRRLRTAAKDGGFDTFNPETDLLDSLVAQERGLPL